MADITLNAIKYLNLYAIEVPCCHDIIDTSKKLLVPKLLPLRICTLNKDCITAFQMTTMNFHNILKSFLTLYAVKYQIELNQR